MSSTNQTFINQTDLSNIYLTTIQIDEILNNYINRLISGLGFITNLSFLFVYSNKKLKGLYSYQFCHCLCNLMVCLVGSLHSPLLKQKIDSNYYYLIFNILIDNFPLRIVLIASGYSDILRILNRYLDLTKKRNIFSHLSKLVNLVLCQGFAIIVCLPAYFGIKIVESNSNGMYFWELNEFGSTKFYIIYVLTVFLIETVIPLTLLTTLNAMSIRRYRQNTLERRRLQTTIKHIKKIEIRFTKTVLILNIILIVSRGLDMIIGVITRIIIFGEVEISRESGILFDTSRTFIFSILFFVHAFESIFYLLMDRNIKGAVTEILNCN